MRKSILVAGLSFAALFGLGGALWVYLETDHVIRERLGSRDFLGPTTFWSSPLQIRAFEAWTAPELAAEFAKRNYERVNSWDQLTEGTYIVGPCGPHPEDPLGSRECWTWRLKPTLHPVLSGLQAQSLALGDSGVIEQVWLKSGSPATWNETELVALEPERLAQFVEGKPLLQEWTPLGGIPPLCLNAVLAIEDPRFLEHAGVNWRGLARAAVVNISQGRFAQGGSTVTQQMVKNFFLNSEKTITRKLRELAMAIVLESQIGKDQIFEIYLNIIYLGQTGPFQVFGYAAASEHYFQKRIQDLSLAECSLLAAVLNSPGRYDPFKNPDNASRRRSLVLAKMLENQMITADEKARAEVAPLPKNLRARVDETSPYFLEIVQRKLVEMGAPVEGLHVFTTLNTGLQEVGQKSLIRQLDALEKRNPAIKKVVEAGSRLEGALVTVETATGRVTSAIGGRGFRLSPFNRLIDSRRQIGSLVKPFVYLAAFENDPDLSAASLLKDEKVSYKVNRQDWTPENYTKKYLGDVSLSYSLRHSLNTSTVALGMETGLSTVLETLNQGGLGLGALEVPSVLLGAIEAPPIDIAKAYLTLARMGSSLPLRWIDHVVYAGGAVESFTELDPESVFTPESTAMVDSILEGASKEGTAQVLSALQFPWPVAGKTGTTSDYRDAWFAGFTPRDLAVVWVGFDQNQNHGLTGASGALPLWMDVMREASRRRAQDPFLWPETLSSQEEVHPPDTKPITVLRRKN